MKCFCGHKAVIFRPYEGRALCPKHFTLSVERNVAKTIIKNRMIVKGDKIAINLSPTCSSVALAAILAKLYSLRADVQITSISIDEGISGYSKDAVRYTSAIAKKLKISNKIVSFEKIFGTTVDRKANEIDNISGAIAIAKRWILNKQAKAIGATKIAIDHTRDSEAQSVILNFLRGDVARLARLGPITAYSISKTNLLFIPRIKPLRFISQKELDLYVKLKRLPIFKRKYPYTNLRDELATFLAKIEKRHPGLSFSIIKTADKLLPAIQKIAQFYEGPIVKCKKCGEPGSQSPCRACQIWRC
jgi:uncharacterized protein (TIGR00269 family)